MTPLAVLLLWAGEMYRQHRPSRITVLALAIAGLASLFLTAPLDLKYGDLGTPILSLAVAIAICFCFFEAAIRAPKWIADAKAIKLPSQGSMFLMFAHPAVYITLRPFLPAAANYMAITAIVLVSYTT